MLKKVTLGSLIMAIICYVGSIATGNAIIYSLCFIMLIGVIGFGLLVFLSNFIWKLLPEDFRKTNKGRQRRFNAIILFSVFVFYIVSGVVEEIFLPETSEFTILLSNIGAFTFAVILSFLLIRQSKAKTVFIISIVYVLFFALLVMSDFATLESGDISNNRSINNLGTLPYVSWVPASDNITKAGVTKYKPELAFNGVNLYSHYQEAYLIDMQGDIVHTWSKKVAGVARWHHVEMCENGDLLVVAACGTLFRLDWDSNLKWKKEMSAHHDICIGNNNELYVIAKEFDIVFWHGIPTPIYNDHIVVLSANGQIKKKSSLFNFVKDYVPPRMIFDVYKGLLSFFKPNNILRIFMLRINDIKLDVGQYIDVLHTNSIEVMDRDINGFCKKGDWLISFRELDLVGILDAEKQEFVWSWGPGELSRQHHPTLLKNGNVLIFDNGRIGGFSRIVELNPLTMEIMWEYKSKPPEDFFSAIRGGNQRLPNGNTLITESDKGRVFEIDKEGKVVWEFYSPQIDPENKERGSIYRMTRITDPETAKLINKLIKI